MTRRSDGNVGVLSQSFARADFDDVLNATQALAHFTDPIPLGAIVLAARCTVDAAFAGDGAGVSLRLDDGDPPAGGGANFYDGLAAPIDASVAGAVGQLGGSSVTESVRISVVAPAIVLTAPVALANIAAGECDVDIYYLEPPV